MHHWYVMLSPALYCMYGNMLIATPIAKQIPQNSSTAHNPKKAMILVRILSSGLAVKWSLCLLLDMTTSGWHCGSQLVDDKHHVHFSSSVGTFAGSCKCDGCAVDATGVWAAGVGTRGGSGGSLRPGRHGCIGCSLPSSLHPGTSHTDILSIDEW